MDRATDVDGFLEALPDEARAALEGLRATIRSAAPDATERIGYGIPAFYHRGRPLVSYGATKRHCAFYVQSPETMEAHRADLTGLDTSKGTIRFDPADPLPAGLVTKLVKARMAEIDAHLAR